MASAAGADVGIRRRGRPHRRRRGPDGGRAEVLGRDVVRDADAVRRRIGLAGQNAAVDPNLTGRENLRMVGMLDGFKPVGRDMDLLRHAEGTSRGGSGYVATSKSATVASDFGPNLYEIRASGGVDVNAVLGSRSPYPGELEVAYPGGVPSSCIVGCRLPTGGWVPNPNFTP